ncbi:MAG: mechanosensitive ion channel family protein [Alphaproteobacteria bacterium]
MVIAYANAKAATWRPLLRAIFVRTRTLARFGLFTVAVAFAAPLFPLSADVADTVQRTLLAMLAVIVGWGVLIATNIALDRYGNRFKLDVEDNLVARKAVTQMRVLKRAVDALIILVTVGFALMSFESVRRFGISLFASAGLAGLIAGLAARPVLSNLIAGVQLAFSQPIRIDDVVVLEGEWGRVEELTSTFVVVKLWDWRRLIVPLNYFFEKPFQNWTRTGASIIGSVVVYVDYTVPVERVREKLNEIVRTTKLWDGKVAVLQVTDVKEMTVELRALVSSANSSVNWDLRCEAREKLLDFLKSEYPSALPRRRQMAVGDGEARFERRDQERTHS